jgi:hypothetical protein
MVDGARGGRAVLLALALMPVFAPAARAQPGLAPAPPATGERVETRRYGWEILAADALVVALAVGTQQAEAVVGLFLTGPMIHAVHGRLGAAGGSLLLRAGAPLGGAYLGLTVCAAGEASEDEFYACGGSIVLGFAVGTTVTLGVDYFVLARKTTVHRAPIQPAFTVGRGAATAGVQLSF